MHHLGEVSHYLNQNRHCLAREKKKMSRKKNTETEQRDLLKTKYLVSVYYVFLLYFCILGIWLILNARERMASAKHIYLHSFWCCCCCWCRFIPGGVCFGHCDQKRTRRARQYVSFSEWTYSRGRTERKKTAFTEFYRTFLRMIWSKEMSFKI